MVRPSLLSDGYERLDSEHREVLSRKRSSMQVLLYLRREFGQAVFETMGLSVRDVVDAFCGTERYERDSEELEEYIKFIRRTNLHFQTLVEEKILQQVENGTERFTLTKAGKKRVHDKEKGLRIKEKRAIRR